MSVSRRFLNLIVTGSSPSIKSLCRINLTRQQLFYTDGDGSEGALQDDALSLPRQQRMDTLQLPAPSFTFRASDKELKIDCFPLADCKVICMDQSGSGFSFDLGTRKVGTMPPLSKPWGVPVTIFVPKPDIDNVISYGSGSSLFLMEKIPRPELSCIGVEVSKQFVGFINHNPSATSGDKSWHCHLLIPPPFVRDPCSWHKNNIPQIMAYGVVGGGSHVCISAQGVGTYSLDTVTHMWSQVGKWTLPFHGKVEYVPELKLWFGLSADTQHLAAADLSRMDSQPQLLGPWKELNLPDEWKECKESQFASLGSGRFCIARFFQATNTDTGFGDDQNFAVLTGVEVNSQGCSGNERNVKLQMTPHKSKRVNNTSIEALF